MQRRTILVTGGAGFIGSAYLNLMVPRYPDYHFVNLDALTYAANRENLSIEKLSNYSFVHADIRDNDRLVKLFKKFNPTHIVHFAAESHVDTSIVSQVEFVETNVLGTLNLLQCAREHHVARFHHISTDEVYGSLPLSAKPATESSTLNPGNPYSASKASADAFVLSFHNTFGLDVVITRSSNNYGPGQHQEKFMPTCIKAFVSGKAAPVYGTGKNIRDWIYVEDNVEGINVVFHAGKAGEIYNIGGGNEVENRDIAHRLLRLVGNSRARISYVRDRLGHDLRYALDTRKVRSLGWKPRTSLDEGLKKTVESYCNR